MQAAYLTALRQVELRDAPDPTIQSPTDVLLDVEVVGVCGSDMHYYRTGRIGDQVVQYPFIVGHECSATVREVGAEVTNVRPGDRVCVDPLIWCHTCDQCLAGRENTCRNQTFLGCPGQAPGCLSERLVMPAASCFAVPESVSAEVAALLEPFCIGLYAAKMADRLAGASIAILGAGPIGLCVLAAAKALGVGTVYMTDIRPERVAFARQYGADWAGNPRESDIVAEILASEPLGVAYAFECAGEQETIDQAVRLLAPGGEILGIGIPELDRVSVEPSTFRRKELSLRAVRRQNRCVEEGIAMAADGKVDLTPMVTHRFNVSQVQEAFDIVADYQDGAIKAMIAVASGD